MILDEGHDEKFAPHQQRVLREKAELEERLSKLCQFINDNPLFEELNGAEQKRLIQQSTHMTDYAVILGERIAAF